MLHASIVKIRKLFFICLAAVTMATSASAGGVICRLEAIQGFEDIGNVAKQYVGMTTSNYKEIAVYVTAKDDMIYLHSNYKGHGYENPSKMLRDETNVDMPNLVANLVFDVKPSYGQIKEFLAAYENDMQFFIDQKLFTNKKYSKFDFGDAKKIIVIGTDGKARGCYHITNSKKYMAVELCPHLYSHVTELEVPNLFKQLMEVKFNSSDVSVVPLTTNHDTLERFREVIPKQNQAVLKKWEYEEVKSVFSSNRGKTIIFIGHFENDSFVVLSSKNSELLTVGIGELEALAKEHNVSLIPLGCKSATSGRRGAATIFNTLDAINRVGKSISADTYGKFYQLLASKDLTLVIDKALLESDHVRSSMKIYRTVSTDGNQIRVASNHVGYIPLNYVALSTSAPSDDGGANPVLKFVAVGAALCAVAYGVKQKIDS